MEVAIRPWDETDAEALAEATLESLPELRPWMPWAADEPMDAGARRAYIRSRNRAEVHDVDRVRAIIANGQIAGGCGLHRRAGPRALSIGYWVRTSLVGNGIATTAVSLLAAEAFTDPSIDHITITHDLANTASAAVASRSGFTLVGDEPAPAEAPGETGTQRTWRLTRADWEARRP